MSVHNNNKVRVQNEETTDCESGAVAFIQRGARISGARLKKMRNEKFVVFRSENVFLKQVKYKCGISEKTTVANLGK